MLIDIHTHAYRVKCPFGANFCTIDEILNERKRRGVISASSYNKITHENAMSLLKI